MRKYALILVAVSLLGLLPLFHAGLFSSHDGDLQIARIAAYYKAIKDGQLLVRWGADLNSGYGHPVLIFMYPLPSYIGAFLFGSGFHLVDVFKIITILSFIGGNLSMYLFLKSFFKTNLVAFLGTIFYAFAPYRFLDMYVRGDIGEEVAFVFIPLVFYCILGLFDKKKEIYTVFGVLCFALVILSHNAMAFLFTPIFIGFWLLLVWYKKDTYVFKQGLLLFILGLLLSSFFWAPALYESKFTHAKTFIGTMYKREFPPFQNLFYSSWGFGSEVGKKGGLSPQIGIMHLIVVCVSVLLLLKQLFKKKTKVKDPYFVTALFFTAVFLCAVFFMTKLSMPLWSFLPFFPYLQFPWRIVSVTMLASSFLASYCVFTLSMNLKKKKVFVWILSCIVLICSIYFWKVESYTYPTDKKFMNYSGDTTWHGQANSIWTDTNKLIPAKEKLELIDGKGEIRSIYRNFTKHTMIVKAETKLRILDNTIYFPGWQALVDGRKTLIEFQDINHRGLITFSVPQGKHKAEVIFKESPIRLFADIVSFISLCIVMICFLRYSKQSR